ncbi:hypothetical protein T484DRAFT_1855212 [Baffinella frigidus]|nr:hypothetical protein T484DRAFT_1855212 [Cryptophyta sp. CCMP2293]
MAQLLGRRKHGRTPLLRSQEYLTHLQDMVKTKGLKHSDEKAQLAEKGKVEAQGLTHSGEKAQLAERGKFEAQGLTHSGEKAQLAERGKFEAQRASDLFATLAHVTLIQKISTWQRTSSRHSRT